MAGFAESTFSVFNINDFEPGVAPTADVIQGKYTVELGIRAKVVPDDFIENLDLIR